METTKQANETQFNQNNYSETLTQFTKTWEDNEGLKSLLNFIAPQVPVAHRFEYKRCNSDDFFCSETDDERTAGSSFKQINFSGDVIQAKTYNKGLTVRVDADDIVGDDWQVRYVHLLMKRLYRNELRRAIAALKHNITPVEVTWGNDSQPDIDVRDKLIRSNPQKSFYANRLLFGELAWFLRQDCYALQNNAGARISSEMSRENLAEKLMVEDIKLLKKQNLGLQGDEITGNEIFAFYAQNDLLKDEPSHIKRFVTPNNDGHLFRVYLEEHTKFVDITVEHYSNIVVTSKDSITQINVKKPA